ncbi:MAG: hypothetical protein FJX66_11375 [Alphaproteobacteria bacterium]|nr:hypothetical protein [Alphaproteobacteria bacterium]
MKEHEEGYSMPLSAPTYTAPPFEAMEEGKILLMVYRADKKAVAWEVPEPLKPYGDGTMLAWIGDMRQPSHSVGLYHECLTGIKVRYGDKVGWYINYIWVDHDMALTFEREIYGWPAHLCETTALRFHGSQVLGDCTRYGETLMRMSMNVTSLPPKGRTKPLEDEIAKMSGGTWLQIRKFPAPARGVKPIKEVLEIPPTDFKLHETWSGSMTLELGKSGMYPNLHALEPKEILGCYLIRASWIVPYPTVLWTNREGGGGAKGRKR